MKRLLHHLSGHLIGIAALPIALAAPVWAGEYVLLGSGFRLHADRHEVEGGVVRIFSEGGVAEVPVTVIVRYWMQTGRDRSGVRHTRSGSTLPCAHWFRRRPRHQLRPGQRLPDSGRTGGAGCEEISPSRLFRAKRHESRVWFPTKCGIAQRRNRLDAAHARNSPRVRRRSAGSQPECGRWGAVSPGASGKIRERPEPGAAGSGGVQCRPGRDTDR